MIHVFQASSSSTSRKVSITVTSDSEDSSSDDDEFSDTGDFEELELQMQLQVATCEILTLSTATLSDPVERSGTPSPYERLAEVSRYFYPHIYAQENFFVRYLQKTSITLLIN